MLAKPPEPLFARIQKFVESKTYPLDALVPINDFAAYYLLASEFARMAATNAEPDLCVLVDPQTAIHVDSINAARLAAKHFILFGKCPNTWTDAHNVIAAPDNVVTVGRDLFLVVLSSHLSLAVVCERGGDSFRGLWSGLRAHTVRIARNLLGLMPEVSARDLVEEYRPPAVEDRSLRCSLRIMELLTRQLAWRQRDMADEKADLNSVLTIMKSVSGKRRAHDILYMFVKQIASVVRVDRCSVVRVWGGDDRGHVLASHEDDKVTDLVIDLQKYPEIAQVMETRQKIVINDTQHDPLLAPFAEDLARARVHSLLVIPIVLFDQNVGSFLLRAARAEDTFTLREISFCEIVAAATSNALERAYLFESVQKAKEQLEFLAVTDALTGVYNRRYFRQRLEDEFERARRYSLPLSCMIMDVDDFKKINDTYGHLQGDTVLRGIAAIALQAVRKSDTVARYGGEEFVILMPQTGIEGAMTESERVRQHMAAHAFEGMPEGHSVTVSVGVAVFDAEKMPDCEALIRVADNALYVAKRQGKNQVVMGQPPEE